MDTIQIIRDISKVGYLPPLICLIQEQMKVIGGNADADRIEKALVTALTPTGNAMLFTCHIDGEEPIAFAFGNICAGLETGAHYFWLNELYVSESYRNRGIASDLLNYIERWAQQNNIKYFACVTGVENVPAQKLYEKNGYAVNHTMWVDKAIK